MVKKKKEKSIQVNCTRLTQTSGLWVTLVQGLVLVSFLLCFGFFCLFVCLFVCCFFFFLFFFFFFFLLQTHQDLWLLGYFEQSLFFPRITIILGGFFFFLFLFFHQNNGKLSLSLSFFFFFFLIFLIPSLEWYFKINFKLIPNVNRYSGLCLYNKRRPRASNF